MNTLNVFSYKKERLYYAAAFAAGAILFLLVFLPYISDTDGIIYFHGDFNSQTVPFTLYLGDVLSGFRLPQYEFKAGTGLGFIEAFGFYNLFSPFTALAALIPQGARVYALPYLIAVKFGVCALNAYVYISRFCKNRDHALAGALMYAFSSYNMLNFVFHYLDAIAFFPLLLTALETAATEKRRGVFGAAVFLCAMVNYYIFGTEVIFVVIYFAARCISGGFRINFRDFLCLAAESVLGAAAAGISLVPAFLSLIVNPRYGDSLGFGSLYDMLVYESPWRYPRIIQAFFMLSDLEGYTNIFPDYADIYPCGSRWSSQAVYIPLFGMSGVIAYMLKNKKDGLTRIFAVCAVIAFVPVLNSMFSFGSSLYYARWMFAPSLIASAMTAEAIGAEPKYFKAGIIANMGVVIACCIFSIFFPMSRLSLWQSLAYYSDVQKWTQFILTAAGLLIVWLLIFRAKRDASYSKLVLVSVIAGAFVMIEFTALFGMGETKHPDAVTKSCVTAPNIGTAEYGRRIADYDYYQNRNLLWDEYNMYFFNSTVNGDLLRYCDVINCDYKWLYDSPPTYSMLSVQYIISRGEPDFSADSFELKEKDGIYNIFENKNFIPIGFGYDSYIYMSELDALEPEARAKIMLKAMAVGDGAVMPVNMEHIAAKDIRMLSDSEFSAECAERAEASAYSFDDDGERCTAKIKLDAPACVFFGFAYDSGFTAYIDGKETEIIKANAGFMAVNADAGEHTIELVYRSDARRIGEAASIAGIAGLSVYIIVCALIKRRRSR